jgi:hypothetical protein
VREKKQDIRVTTSNPFEGEKNSSIAPYLPWGDGSRFLGRILSYFIYKSSAL